MLDSNFNNKVVDVDDVGVVNSLPDKVLVTSAWPYINVIPHLGNLVGSVLSADVTARYYRLKGDEVIFVSGSDEHGTPIEVEALKQGITPKELTQRNHGKVSELFQRWGASYDNYTFTENSIHKEFVQKTLLEIQQNGYIFEQQTQMLYCEHDQRFLPDRFVEGKCPHCGMEKARGDQCDLCGKLLEPTALVEPYCIICKNKPIVKSTKHWYIDLSKLAKPLSEYIEANQQLPANVKSFSLNWIKEGLKPRAVTRDVEWGISAPFKGAEGKTIYVWIDAVLGYISAAIEQSQRMGQPEKWKEFWLNSQAKTLYFVGKDNIPFHTIILPALLLASGKGYNLPWSVSATEFLQFRGQKASKSQRVGIWIDEALEMFPVDYWRFFLISTRPESKDTNFTWSIFVDKINADLNDTFGNFIHRTLSFITSKFDGTIPSPTKLEADDQAVLDAIKEKVEQVAKEIEAGWLQSAANTLISISRVGNQYLNTKEPWNIMKTDREKAGTIFYVVAQVVKAATVVAAPFMPQTAEQLWQALQLPGNVCKWSEATIPIEAGHTISKPSPFFHKVETDEAKLDEQLSEIRIKLGTLSK
ncbi:MAG: methionine--tRNA ligase [Candidatus Bathyarchaeota archaeon]|uniref:methionine--tRNA ligase n=1 Tax=Candidatus Bathycorpusculum sp. TaxID=2994959 RepID=UPI00282EC36A|nr:methionine--tRNA ligase [Candidatus Termiticorpusculum sp.]MCL2292729.1 methionine--tRNA ligase [Candidatus Termiticorpusculum sp.]